MVEPVHNLKEFQQESIASPMTGKVVKLEDVPDEVFATGAMVKVLPLTQQTVSYHRLLMVKSLLSSQQNTPVGLRTESSVELLIHVGMDMVFLDGKGFTTFVKAGDKVQAGKNLLDFDLKAIRDAGRLYQLSHRLSLPIRQTSVMC